jgi:hypothetical protein
MAGEAEEGREFLMLGSVTIIFFYQALIRTDSRMSESLHVIEKKGNVFVCTAHR